ncbi:hypothetical protein BU17DRAFT_61457 [Hysterangium stoloniferum]|nr:hypothetical protein BU17DRAFT_61457 [Hysterangium stoloniferum]
MFRGPFSLLSSRMLDFRAHEPVSYHASDSPPLCVAPKDIFPDYETVMAGLRQQSTYHEGEDVILPFVDIDRMASSNDGGSETESPLDVPSTPETTYTPNTVDDDDEYIGTSKRQTSSRKERSGRHPQTRRDHRDRNPYRCSRAKPKQKDADEAEDDAGLRCTYSNPHWQNGRRCTKINKSSNERARHWRSCHEFKEAKSMLAGNMPRESGTAIKSEAQLRKIQPVIECQRCGKFITRSDAMLRHLKTNCRPE